MGAVGTANISRLADALRESAKKSEVTTQDVMIHSSNYLLSEMERRVAVDSGNLRDSLGVKVDGNRVIIGPDATKAPYGGYVERGTKPHVIEPKDKQALAFRYRGQMVIVKKVRHPGTKAQPFVRPAFEAWVDSLGPLVAEANVKVIREAAS